MAYIKSRKHAVARASAPSFGGAAAATLIAISMPVAAQTSGASTLREVSVEATADSYKADTSSSPKFTQPLVDTPQTITVIKKEVLAGPRRHDADRSAAQHARHHVPDGRERQHQHGRRDLPARLRHARAASSSTASATSAPCRATSSTSNRSRSSRARRVPTSAAAAPTGYINLVTQGAARRELLCGRRQLRLRRTSSASTIDLNRVLNESGTVRIPPERDGAGRRRRRVATCVKNKRWGIAPSLAFGLSTPTRVYLALPAPRPEQPPRRRHSDHRPGRLSTCPELARIGGNGAPRRHQQLLRLPARTTTT